MKAVKGGGGKWAVLLLLVLLAGGAAAAWYLKPEWMAALGIKALLPPVQPPAAQAPATQAPAAPAPAKPEPPPPGQAAAAPTPAPPAPAVAAAPPPAAAPVSPAPAPAAGAAPAPTATAAPTPAAAPAPTPTPEPPKVEPPKAEPPAVVQKAPEPAKEPAKAPPKAAPKGLKQMLAEAQRLRERGKVEKALDLYGRIAETHPDNPEALAGRGWCYLDLSQYPPAEASFQAALLEDPMYAEALIGLAETYRYQGRRADAVGYYQRYLAAHPNGEDAVAARNALSQLKE